MNCKEELNKTLFLSNLPTDLENKITIFMSNTDLTEKQKKDLIHLIDDVALKVTRRETK